MSNQNLQVYDTAHGKNKKAVAETTNRTKEALDRIVAKKLHNDKVTTLSSSSTNDGATYVKYTSAQLTNLSGSNETSLKQRVIKITDEKVDPMLPSSFKIRKVPQGPPTDDIVPVIHDESNTEKLTKADQKKWQIAPSVSNWKNNKGFIIGIENRLRNSEIPTQMTPADVEKSTQRFTALSDALKNAENKAKEDLKTRSSWRKRKETEQTAETQARLSKLAEDARTTRSLPQHDDMNSVDKLSDKHERRAERRRKAEEELKRERISTKDKVRALVKEQGREVSERVLLGVTEAYKKRQKESVFDTDLYLRNSQSSKPTETDDKVYDQPLFDQGNTLKDVLRSRNGVNYRGLGASKEAESDATSVLFEKDENTSIKSSLPE
jgi:SNW domain-containing protein 1